jgi:hypothetical protein
MKPFKFTGKTDQTRTATLGRDGVFVGAYQHEKRLNSDRKPEYTELLVS